jgi:TRAP-type mannitol/chloroaromatic compound transport system substrate-binding protein
MAHDKTPATPEVVTQAASPETPASTSRRRFLTGSAAAVGAAAAVGFPSVAVAQTTTLCFQSTWPNQDIFHEFASDYVRIVNEMSGGRLRLNLLPAGAVVGPCNFRTR